jgi:hypothetical protein
MHKILSTIFVALILALQTSTQPVVSPMTKKDVLVSKEKPTVYLTFEKAGPRSAVYAAESDQGVWLRLHNNTKWAINIATLSTYAVGEKTKLLHLIDGRSVFGLREGVEISPCHGVEVVDRYESRKMPDGSVHINENVNVPDPPVGYNRGGHVSGSAWLSSGHSVIFSVPKEHLAKRLAIFASFRYEWETAERDYGAKEPEHRVYFRAADLPKNIAEK